MEDRILFRIALTTSILGIIGIILFSGQIGPNKVVIGDINRGMLDEEVMVEGVVDDLKQSPNSQTYFLELMDSTGKIEVVIFDKNVDEYEKNNLKLNYLLKRRIKVLGTVSEYNGHLELILKDAKSLNVMT
jgi:DNA/RNA endonuclease YhcR with UshA esterase domain